MPVLQHSELTRITLQMITPQPKDNDLIQEIRGPRYFWQCELFVRPAPNSEIILNVLIVDNRPCGAISYLANMYANCRENNDSWLF